MKVVQILFLMLLISCAINQTHFNPPKVCSPGALHVYLESIIKGNKAEIPIEVKSALHNLKPQINKCYQDYIKQNGMKEFETCLVVIYDDRGEVVYTKFSSQYLNENYFLNCASETLKNFSSTLSLKNKSILQSYNFYVD